MIIVPAVDLKDGKVVRLVQGDFQKVTVYSDDPLATAQRWVDQGAKWLHVVDLDGAQSGIMKNFQIIEKIARSVTTPIEVGGGLRSFQDVEKLIALGVARVILGTSAVENRDLLKELLAKWPEKIAVSMDTSGGKMVTKGWAHRTDIAAVDLAGQFEAMGLRFMIDTDIRRDGMLNGPNMPGIKNFLKGRKAFVIASGGITSLDDVKNLLHLNDPHLWGAIVGKAVYDQTLDLRQAIDLCSPNASSPA